MGTYPQQVDIRAGKDNFVGSVEVRSSLLTQNGAGLSGGAFALVLEHNFLMNNSVSIGSFAAKALNTTYPLHGESETPGEPLYRFDWWAAMPLWTCRAVHRLCSQWSFSSIIDQIKKAKVLGHLVHVF